MIPIDVVNTLLVKQEEEIEATKNGTLDPKAGRVVQGMRRNQLTYIGHVIQYRRLQTIGAKGPKLFDGLLTEATTENGTATTGTD